MWAETFQALERFNGKNGTGAVCGPRVMLCPSVSSLAVLRSDMVSAAMSGICSTLGLRPLKHESLVPDFFDFGQPTTVLLVNYVEAQFAHHAR